MVINKKTLFLITTEIKNTWKNKNKNKIFLGEWCFQSHQNNNRNILKYHWKNKNIFKKDYEYINFFYEKILENLTNKLNKIHKINLSKRSWRIIIGPWLTLFTQVLFDRFKALESLNFSDYNYETIAITYDKYNFLSEDYSEFKYFVQSSFFNHYLYFRILNYYEKINFIIIKNNEKSKIKPKKNNSKFYNLLLKFLNKIFFNKEVNIYFETNLSDKILNKLNYSDGLYNRYLGWYFNYFESKSNTIDFINRENFKYKYENKFEEIFQDLIFEFLPKLYLENFKFNYNKINNDFNKNKILSIFTSNSHLYHDQFKILIASQIENKNSKLCIYQHGGNDMILNIQSWADHERNIADIKFNWGDYNSNNKNIFLGIENENYFKKKFKNNNLFIVAHRKYNYSNHYFSDTMAFSQKKEMFDNIEKLLDSLNYSILSNTIVRTAHNNFAHYTSDTEEKFINKKFKKGNKVEIDYGIRNFNDTFYNSKIIISAYVSTSFLKGLANNIPTFLILNSFTDIKHDNDKLIKNMKNNKLIFDNSEDLANHINNIWDNPYKWWNNNKTQKCVKELLENFCKINENIDLTVNKYLN